MVPKPVCGSAYPLRVGQLFCGFLVFPPVQLRARFATLWETRTLPRFVADVADYLDGTPPPPPSSTRMIVAAGGAGGGGGGRKGICSKDVSSPCDSSSTKE